MAGNGATGDTVDAVRALDTSLEAPQDVKITDCGDVFISLPRHHTIVKLSGGVLWRILPPIAGIR